MSTRTTGPEQVNVQEAQELIGVSKRTFYEMRLAGKFPPPLDIGLKRGKRWLKRDVLAWLERRQPK